MRTGLPGIAPDAEAGLSSVVPTAFRSEMEPVLGIQLWVRNLLRSECSPKSLG